MFRFGDLLTLDNVLKRVSPLQIFRFYNPKLNIGKVTNSPFREDNNPSFGLFVSKDTNEVIYNDLRGGDAGNWIKYLKKLYNIDFIEVLRIVNRDMNLDLIDYNEIPILTKQVKSKIIKDVNVESFTNDLELNIVRRHWKKHDIEYWNNYGVNVKNIEHETFPISSYWFNDWKTNIAEKYSYNYDFYYDGKMFRRKIYQPYSKIHKWKTNLNSLVIDGIKNIPKSGDLLIITKSRKDRYVLNSLGYHAISTTNESSWIPDINFKKLNKRYKNLIIFFDNDEAGMNNSLRFSDKYKINRIFIPNINKEKDISDFRFSYGQLTTIKLIKYLLNEINNKKV
jgi:5S rRNA maturation endonuclease (ribonuclease M5)